MVVNSHPALTTVLHLSPPMTSAVAMLLSMYYSPFKAGMGTDRISNTNLYGPSSRCLLLSPSIPLSLSLSLSLSIYLSLSLSIFLMFCLPLLSSIFPRLSL